MACKYQYNGEWYSEIDLERKLNSETNPFQTLYNNLVTEISNTQKGKEVLDRIKRDYKYKDFNNVIEGEVIIVPNAGDTRKGKYYLTNDNSKDLGNYSLEEIAEKYPDLIPKYTLEEQQEEAIVELLGMMTAERLDAVKDGKLISLLKRLLKEIKAFVKNLLRQREVEVDKLPDNMTIGDLADLLAYSNSKLILPGNEVIYTTPDNQTFKTYVEASNHISELAKNAQDVDLNNVSIQGKKVKKAEDIVVDSFEIREDDGIRYYRKIKGSWYEVQKNIPEFPEDTLEDFFFIGKDQIVKIFNSADSDFQVRVDNSTSDFISKNKEYEQSKEIIEEWMRVNNIRYNPEEIYSRGQEFVSIVGAYSNFDVNLMMQNLLQHIEDNQKAGGEFAVSAITKPVDRKIGHLEGGGGKIRFKIYPQPHDILWAANADVYSGSVWDAGEKINKDKKSELLGVTYSKYPGLGHLNHVKPNLAEIVDDLDHHHNELGIALTGSNFRLDYDDDIPYQTKKIIDSINRILDQKYGKLRKPTTTGKLEKPVWRVFSEIDRVNFQEFDSEDSAKKWMRSAVAAAREVGSDIDYIVKRIDYVAVQPKITSKDLKESIYNVKKKLEKSNRRPKTLSDLLPEDEFIYDEADGKYYKTNLKTKEEFEITKEEFLGKNKEYIGQALVNTKVAKLKEVAKKYPRALIRSEVRSIKNTDYSPNLFDDDFDLPFQKIPSQPTKVNPNEAQLKSLLEQAGFNIATLDEYNKATGNNFDVNGLVDFTARTVAIANGNIDALTEEIAHIAGLHAEGTKEFAAAMVMIEDTEEFEKYYNQYMQVYNDDNLVRKEILGKLIKKELEVKLGTSLGSILRRLWNKFLNIFRNQSLQSYISKITDEFIANPNRPIPDTGIMFQLKQEEKLLAGQVSNLKERLRKLRKRGLISKSTMNQILALENELEGAKNGVGIYKFLGLLESDIKASLDFIGKYFNLSENKGRIYLGERTDLETPSSKAVLQLSQFIGYYLPFLKELNSIVDAEASIGEGRKKALDRNIRNHVEKFELINRAYRQLLQEDGERTIKDSGLPLDLDLLKYAYKDSNFLETWFAPIRYNTDQLLRLVHRLVFDLNQKIRRATLDWSDNFLSNAVDYIGKDISWVAEKREVTKEKKDKDGKVIKTYKVIETTGYFLSDVKRGEWDSAREEFHTKLHDKYGFSQDFTERLQQKKKIQNYKDSPYRQTQRFIEAQRDKLKAYNKEIAEWYNFNSTVRPDVDEVINLRKQSLSKDQYKLWEFMNMELNEDGSVKYYKGELVSPSVGKTKTIYDGSTIRTIDWTNHEFNKLNQKDRDFLNYLKEKKREIDSTIPFSNPDLLPQMYESTLDILVSGSPNLFSKLGRNIKSSVVKESDDTLFNDNINLGDGSILDEVPLRFTNLLKEPDRISTDILSSIIGYKNMQENYVQKSARLPEFENILQLAKTRKVAGKKETVAGEQSWSYQALKNFLQVHLSGQEKQDLEIDILGKTISVTKIIEKLSQWVRSKNLGLNLVTMTSNLLSAKIFATIESLVGTYTTMKSSAFANKEFFRLLPSVLSTVKDTRSKDRISTLMQHFGLGSDIRSLFDDLNKHVLMRNQPEKGLMYGYHIGDYFMKSTVMIAVLDNYRVHDNQWYTAEEAKKNSLNFNEMTSAYDMLEISDGKVRTTIPESVIANLTARMSTLASQVDGSLRPEDKAAIYQHAVFSMIGLHRGWFFEGIARRFKAKGYDYTLQRDTEGQYRTIMDLIGKFIMSKEKMQTLRNLLANYNNLEDYQKENVKRVMYELGMIAAFTIIALTLNSGDDDEEDYFRDLLAYQSNRVLIEVSSFYNPNEYISVLRDPIVPARDLELLTSWSDLFNSDKIESGKWEGLTKQQKYLLQLVPGVKGYTSISSPESSNRLLQHKNLKPLYTTYDFFTGKDKE